MGISTRYCTREPYQKVKLFCRILKSNEFVELCLSGACGSCKYLRYIKKGIICAYQLRLRPRRLFLDRNFVILRKVNRNMSSHFYGIANVLTDTVQVWVINFCLPSFPLFSFLLLLNARCQYQ